MGSKFFEANRRDGKPPLMNAKDKQFSALYDKAHEAGMAAGKAALPTPMIVGEADGLSTDFKPGGKKWYVSEGACGFAWIKVRPGTSPFARFLKKFKGEGRAYDGGVDIWVGEFGQSIARKEAYAAAFAQVLREGGIEHAYPRSRLD